MVSIKYEIGGPLLQLACPIYCLVKKMWGVQQTKVHVGGLVCMETVYLSNMDNFDSLYMQMV
jgi:hypothetical protein